MAAYVLGNKVTGEMLRAGSCPLALLPLQAVHHDHAVLQISEVSMRGGNPDFASLRDELAAAAEGARAADLAAAPDMQALLLIALNEPA